MPSTHWAEEAVFYHIYPLGFCGAPTRNDFRSAPVPRLEKLLGWIPHLQALDVNAVYLGPLFESSAHGYDTADYYHLDRRLGDDATLARVCDGLHRAGMRIILDGVFNHVGRDFWAFRDVRARGSASPYCGWFHLDFGGRSTYGDQFAYQGWNGHYDLVKLNLANPEVRGHLFEAVRTWQRDLGLDGLRLDTADCLDFDFMQALRSFTRSLRPDFWLMGEVIHGDYRRWANPGTLDSVTNYECYKGLYSSLAERNYFEIAYALNRQFGPDGLYRGLTLYNFADNHDVDRVASRLHTPAHLYPLYCLLFSMPGVPSLYYGSEWGLEGRRGPGDDAPLRPCLDLGEVQRRAPQPDLPRVLARLSAVRRASPALMHGDYRPLHVSAEQLAFLRSGRGESVVVAINAAAAPVRLELRLPVGASRAVDLLEAGAALPVRDGKLDLDPLPSRWARFLRLE